MARFRVTDANAPAFAAMRRVLDGTAPFTWLYGKRRSGKGYALSALYRERLHAEPTGVHLYMDAGYLLFILAGAKRQGRLPALMEALTYASTLLIDDVESLVGNSEREALLHQLVMYRRGKERPTVLTSTHHPLLVVSDLSVLRIMLLYLPTAALSPLLLKERRAIIEQEAGLHVPAMPPYLLPFLLKHGGETEHELRKTTRRVLFTATYQIPLPHALRGFDALRR